MPIAQDRGTLHLIYSIYIPPAAAHKDAAQIPFIILNKYIKCNKNDRVVFMFTLIRVN